MAAEEMGDAHMNQQWFAVLQVVAGLIGIGVPVFLILNSLAWRGKGIVETKVSVRYIPLVAIGSAVAVTIGAILLGSGLHKMWLVSSGIAF
jgi:hypothetical protein